MITCIEHPSLTGWSQNNSLNASGIIGGESFRHNNQAPPARQSEINLDSQTEKQKDNSLEIMLPELKENPVERPSIPEPKRIEIVPEAIKEESVPQSRKRSRDVLMKNTKSPTTTVTSKPSPIIKSQKSADFNNTGLQFFHTTRTMEFPLSIPASPGSHKNVIKERTQSPTAFHRTSSPMSRTSYSKLLADPLRTTQDFKIFRMGKLKMDSSNNGAERRSATVLKARPHQQTLYIPNTVLSGSKLVKYEDPAKQKNLRLTKGLSLWSQTTPQNNTMGESTIGLKYSEPLSLESPGIRTFSQTPVGIITTKVFNFMGDKLDKEDNDIKLGLLPKFKTTIKVKRPVEEDKSELELSNPPSKFEAWRMRQTSPLKFFTSTKDMDSSNGFKRKYSRNLQQRSELKRRPTNDTFKDDTEITAQDIPVTAKEGKESEKDSTLEVNVGKKNTQRVMDKVAKIIKKRSIEVKDIIFEGDHDGKVKIY